MTEPTDPVDEADVDQVDEQLDTSGGERDPLSTDDGLAAAAAAGMPEETFPGEDDQPADTRELLDTPGLDVGDDGTDPCAELGHADEED